MIKIFLSALLVLIGITPLLAQFSISGKIYDAETSNALPGANILLVNTFKGDFADADGSYLLNNLAAGEYVIRVSFIGYETLSQVVVVNEPVVTDFGLKRSTTLAEEFVVRATRAGGTTAVAYTNINKDELEAVNLGQDMPVLMSMTPSVIVNTDAGNGVGYTSLRIRGSDNSRINVTLNGIPLNDAESHGVWWVNMPDLATSVDNLQIQRGVGLSTHGAGAFGGTISMQTASLKSEAYAEIQSSAGSFGTFRNSVSVGSGLIKNRLAFDGRLSEIRSNGYIDRASSRLGSWYFSGGWFGEKTVLKAVLLSGNERTYQAWNGVPSDSLKTNRTFNPSGLYYDAEGNIRYYDNETDNYRQDHYQLHLTHSINRNLTLNLSGHYTHGRGYYEQYRANERFSRYNLPNVVIGDVSITRTDLIRQRWLDNHFYGLVYSLNYNPLKRLDITLGGGYNIYQGDHFGEIIWARHAMNIEKGHRYYDNDATKTDFNTFVKAIFELWSGAHFFADLQVRSINYNFMGKAWVNNEVTDIQQDADFTFFNPKAGINYQVNSNNRFHLYAGVGNKEPVRRDFTESSPESRPTHETLYNFETGYTFTGTKFTTGLNIFVMNYKNQLILTGEINDVGGFTRTNIDNSYRRGVELEAGLAIAPGLKWEGNLTLSENVIQFYKEFVDQYDNNWNWTGYTAVERSNTHISFSPPLVAASLIQFQPVKSLSAGLQSKYVGSQYIDNTSSKDRMLDAYHVHNLLISYTFMPKFAKEMRFNLMVNNLLNAMYSSNAWVYKGVVGDQGLLTLDDGFFPQAGTNFLAGITLKF